MTKENDDIFKTNEESSAQGDGVPHTPSGSLPDETDLFADDGHLDKLLNHINREAAPKPLHSLVLFITQLTLLQKALLAGIVLVAAILLYALAGVIRPAPNTPYSADPNTLIPESKLSLRDKQPVETSRSDEPIGLVLANQYYMDGDYRGAYDVLEKLYHHLPLDKRSKGLKELLRYKMALCAKGQADIEKTFSIFQNLAKSNYPAIAVLSNFQISLLEMQKKQYLNSHMRAYQALALIDAAGFDEYLSARLKRNCQFMAAQAITKELMQLSEYEVQSQQLQTALETFDTVFNQMDQHQIETLLNSGLEKLQQSVLAPVVSTLEAMPFSEPSTKKTNCYSASCFQASIEELMTRIAVAAKMDIIWNSQNTTIRKRPLKLYCAELAPEALFRIAAGACGLLARKNGENQIAIDNPAEYTVFSRHIGLLSNEAISLWREFILNHHDDPRLDMAHFALALIYRGRERIDEALAEYKLLANRFAHSPLAPYALLYASRIKAKILNYEAACKDLRQLVEQYPDAPISVEGCWYLAQTTAQTGRHEEAVQLYRKVFNLAVSLNSQIDAAMGAAHCFYQIEDYPNCQKWLARYFNLTKDTQNPQRQTAYLLSGKAWVAQNQYEKACAAFELALDGKLSKSQYIQTISSLVNGYIQLKRFVDALERLEDVYPSVHSDTAAIEILLLKSRVLREMGLPEKAAVFLNEKNQFVTDPKIKARICMELAYCSIAQKHDQHACQYLDKLLVTTNRETLTNETGIRLAELYMILNQNQKTIEVCKMMLERSLSESQRNSILHILGQAYQQQHHYDKAVMAFLGQWKEQ